MDRNENKLSVWRDRWSRHRTIGLAVQLISPHGELATMVSMYMLPFPSYRLISSTFLRIRSSRRNASSYSLPKSVSVGKLVPSPSRLCKPLTVVDYEFDAQGSGYPVDQDSIHCHGHEKAPLDHHEEFHLGLET